MNPFSNRYNQIYIEIFGMNKWKYTTSSPTNLFDIRESLKRGITICFKIALGERFRNTWNFFFLLLLNFEFLETNQ